MWKPKSILALTILALGLTACGKGSNNNSGTVVYGSGVSVSTYSNFPQYCVSAGGVMLSGLSSNGTAVCDLPRGIYNYVAGGIQLTLFGSYYNIPLSVNAGDTIKVGSPTSNLSFYVNGVAPTSTGVVGSAVIFQAPVGGTLQFAVNAGFQSYSFTDISVQTCFDQNNAIYACP